MQESETVVVLVSPFSAGCKSIRNALEGKEFNAPESPIITSDVTININQSKKAKLRLLEIYDGDLGILNKMLTRNADNVGIICIIVNAMESAERQLAEIQQYKHEIENSLQSSQEILIIADKRTELAELLTPQQLKTLGLTPKQYIAVLTNEQTKSATVKEALETKFAEILLTRIQKQLSAQQRDMDTDENKPLLKKDGTASASLCSKFSNLFNCCKPSAGRNTEPSEVYRHQSTRPSSL